MIRRLDLSLDSPAENLALDEALFRDLERSLELEATEALESDPSGERRNRAPGTTTAESSRGWLRFWESSSYFVVLGVASRIDDDVDRAACDADGIPILRRASGGGTVLQGPGCLNFALALPMVGDSALRDIRSSYERIAARTGEALALEGVGLRGSSDLALESIKFSGNAQKRGRHALLHHGTILHAFDVSRIERYLREPPKRPSYRGRRVHREFVANLSLDGDAIRERIAGSWRAEAVEDPGAIAHLREELSELVRTKYALASWNERF